MEKTQVQHLFGVLRKGSLELSSTELRRLRRKGRIPLSSVIFVTGKERLFMSKQLQKMHLRQKRTIVVKGKKANQTDKGDGSYLWLGPWVHEIHFVQKRNLASRTCVGWSQLSALLKRIVWEAIRPFHISHNTTFYINIVFNFSRDVCKSQEKLKTMLMHSFFFFFFGGGGGRGDSKLRILWVMWKWWIQHKATVFLFRGVLWDWALRSKPVRKWGFVFLGWLYFYPVESYCC